MENTARTIQELRAKCTAQEQQLAELTARLKWFEEQFRLRQQRRFGVSSEQTHPDQLKLFNEIEAPAKPAPEPAVEEITYRRRKK